jgi:hypothetical protein
MNSKREIHVIIVEKLTENVQKNVKMTKEAI